MKAQLSSQHHSHSNPLQDPISSSHPSQVNHSSHSFDLERPATLSKELFDSFTSEAPLEHQKYGQIGDASQEETISSPDTGSEEQQAEEGYSSSTQLGSNESYKDRPYEFERRQGESKFELRFKKGGEWVAGSRRGARDKLHEELDSGI